MRKRNGVPRHRKNRVERALAGRSATRYPPGFKRGRGRLSEADQIRIGEPSNGSVRRRRVESESSGATPANAKSYREGSNESPSTGRARWPRRRNRLGRGPPCHTGVECPGILAGILRPARRRRPPGPCRMGGIDLKRRSRSHDGLPPRRKALPPPEPPDRRRRRGPGGGGARAGSAGSAFESDERTA